MPILPPITYSFYDMDIPEDVEFIASRLYYTHVEMGLDKSDPDKADHDKYRKMAKSLMKMISIKKDTAPYLGYMCKIYGTLPKMDHTDRFEPVRYEDIPSIPPEGLMEQPSSPQPGGDEWLDIDKEYKLQVESESNTIEEYVPPTEEPTTVSDEEPVAEVVDVVDDEQKNG